MTPDDTVKLLLRKTLQQAVHSAPTPEHRQAALRWMEKLDLPDHPKRPALPRRRAKSSQNLRA